jgi:hypothetical protein
VALYFENSILKSDLPLLAASSAIVTRYSKERRRITVETPADIEMNWAGEGALLDGKPWPVQSSTAIRVPAGVHTIEPAVKREAIALIDLNATLLSAAIESGRRIAFEYTTESRAIARFDHKPSHLEVDGTPLPTRCVETGECAVLLPHGKHRVVATD